MTKCLDRLSYIGIAKTPKNIKTCWLLVLNQIKYLRLNDIFFIGHSNVNYPSKTSSFLLGDETYYTDFIGKDSRSHPKFSLLYEEF